MFLYNTRFMNLVDYLGTLSNIGLSTVYVLNNSLLQSSLGNIEEKK